MTHLTFALASTGPGLNASNDAKNPWTVYDKKDKTVAYCYIGSILDEKLLG